MNKSIFRLLIALGVLAATVGGIVAAPSLESAFVAIAAVPSSEPTAAPQPTPNPTPDPTATAAPTPMTTSDLAVAERLDGDGTVAGYTINDVISAQPDLSTLYSLLARAGLEDALGGAGSFTLFAPTNEAFDKISKQLGTLQADGDALLAVMLYHVLNGAQDGASLSQATTVETQLPGKTIAVSINAEGQIVLNDSANVFFPDASTVNNGVIHIIDEVLVPIGEAALRE